MQGTINEHILAKLALSPKEYIAAGAENGAGIQNNIPGHEEALLVVNLGDVTSSATVTVTVEDSADGVSWALISGATTGALAIGDKDKVFTGRIHLKNHRAHFRAVVTPGGSGVALMGATFMFGEPKEFPITQDNEKFDV